MSQESQLLDAIIERGSDADFAAWVGSGRAGLLVLREALEKRGLRWEGVHPKDAIDGLSAAAAEIAAKHPDEFLEVFADRHFDENVFVLTGLGQIDDQRATDRLAAAAKSKSSWTRMDAAIGLGRRQADVAVRSLLALLDDPDYLVRYHTLRSLGAVGDADALRALTAFRDDPSKLETDLAEDAILLIEQRVGSGASGNTQTLRPRDIRER